MRTTRAEPSRCSEPRARLLAFGAAFAVTVAAAAQDPQPPPATPPPGARVDPQGQAQDPLVYDPAVRAMEGKTVRSVRFLKAERGNLPLRPLEAATADSYVRGLSTRVGQPFETRKISADCGSLWTDRRAVTQVYAADVDGEIAVTFVVMREVEIYESVVFEGLAALERVTVDGLLGIYPDRQITRTEAEAMRKVLLARYRRDGYALCSVTIADRPDDVTVTSSGEPAPVAAGTPRTLVFVVDEGPKISVRNVTFVGNRSFAADAILGRFGVDDYLLRESRMESGPSRGLLGGGAYSTEVLEEDLDKLRRFYRSRGFLDATVDLAEIAFTPDREHVDLTFLVVEGPRYRIRSVRLEHVLSDQSPLVGAPRYSAEEITEKLKVAPGEFYDHDRLQRDVQAIRDFYGERGHPPWDYAGMSRDPSGCQVFTPQETYGLEPEVDIVYQVSEGVPKKLRDVVIRGNRFTKDEVIRRRVRVYPGEPIDMLAVNRSLRSIEQSRYFHDPVTLVGPRLQLEPVPGEPDVLDIGLDVVDGPTGQLRWGIGVSTGQGVSGQITFNKSNFDLGKPPSSWNPITAFEEILDNKAFHGGGQNLQALFAPGTRVSQFQVSWSEPDIFGQHIDTYELRLSGRRTIRRLQDGAVSDILGGEIGLSHFFTDYFNVGLSTRLESVEVDRLAPDATSLAFDAEGQTELRGARLTARYRDLDDFMRPTEGLEISVAADLVGGPLGGEESLTKFTHAAQVYLPVSENEMGHRTVLHLEHVFGLATEFGGSNDVFLTERFYLGGPNLRGFDFRRAGPKQFTRPLGGEAIYTATAEVFFPLVATRLEGEVRDRELLRGVIFTDFGLLGLGIDDPTFRELRAASGFGIRIEIPLLEIPIALDLGWPWMYEDSDDRQQLYFSISSR